MNQTIEGIIYGLLVIPAGLVVLGTTAALVLFYCAIFDIITGMFKK